MFTDARSFNRNLNNWNTSNVTNMSNMFKGATAYNNNNVQLVTTPNGWNTNNVINMTNMFTNATIISSLRISNPSISYSILNTTSSTQNIYLFRFNGIITPPTTLNLSTDGIMIITPNPIVVNPTSTFPNNTSYNTIVDNTNINYTKYTYAMYNGNTPGASILTNINGTIDSVTSCFIEGTKILCYNNSNEMYMMIQDIKKGDLVKTYNHNYMKVHSIMKTNIYNTYSSNITNMLYRLSKENYPELFEDLIITGGHSILVDKITYEDIEKTLHITDSIYMTDNKVRLLACVDMKASYYDNVGYHTIYHIALENDNIDTNYGIYANGLLVESCPIKIIGENNNTGVFC